MRQQIFEWSYIPPERHRKNHFANQLDWNYTIITRINEAYNRFRSESDENRSKLVSQNLIVPYKLFALFCMMDYFDYESMVLSGRYKIVLVDKDVDYIECEDINSIIMVNNLFKKWDYIPE